MCENPQSRACNRPNGMGSYYTHYAVPANTMSFSITIPYSDMDLTTDVCSPKRIFVVVHTEVGVSTGAG